MRKTLSFIPGLAACVAVVLVSGYISRWLGIAILAARGIDPAGKASPISTITIAVVIAILFRNLARLPAAMTPGVSLAIKRILRIGIVLVGLKLSLAEIARLGIWGVPTIAVLIAVALIVTKLLARILGVSNTLATLTAAATSICGITAAVATAPAIDADDQELAYTVANVTLFGLIAMLTYPYIAHAFFATESMSAGMFLGTGIHDTSQVIGAALAYRDLFGDELAFEAATVTKLTRNMFLVVVVPLLAFVHARGTGRKPKKVSLSTLLPLFLAGFLLMVVVRTIGDLTLARNGKALLLFDASGWDATIRFLGDHTSAFLLAVALAAVGFHTDLRKLRALGPRPLYLGAAAAITVAATGLALAALVGPMAG